MTVIDPTGQVEIHRLPGDDAHVVVQLPLTVRSETWMREIQQLARAKDLTADVREFPEATYLMVRVPSAASREETAELLDGALRVIEDAQALDNARQSDCAATEQYIKDWWESRKQPPQGDAPPD